MNGDLSAGGDGIISDAQVYGNILYENKLAAGINMDGLQDPIIYNNLIYNNHTASGHRPLPTGWCHRYQWCQNI